MSRSTHHRFRIAKWVALVALFAFVVLYVTLHFLRSDYNPIAQHSSVFVLGKFGWMMVAAFFAVGAGSWALGEGLRHAVAESKHRAWGVRLVQGFGALAIVSGVFPTDAVGQPWTVHGAIHVIASLTGFVLMIGAMFFFGRAFYRDQRWRRHGHASTVLGVTAAIVLVTKFAVPNSWGIEGLIQRALILVLVLWSAAVLPRLWQLRPGADVPDSAAA